jgi:hypothetical protein
MTRAAFKARRAAYQRAWAKKNRAKIKRYKKNWEVKNRDKHLAYKRQKWPGYYARNKNKRLQTSREYQRANRALYREWVQAWRQKNSDTWNAHCREYYRLRRYGQFKEASKLLHDLIQELVKQKRGNYGQENKTAHGGRAQRDALGNAERHPRKEGQSPGRKRHRVPKPGDHARRSR